MQLQEQQHRIPGPGRSHAPSYEGAPAGGRAHAKARTRTAQPRGGPARLPRGGSTRGRRAEVWPEGAERSVCEGRKMGKLVGTARKRPGWRGAALHAAAPGASGVQIKPAHRTSLVVQWLRIHLPMQGTWVQSLVQEDSLCHGTAKPVNHNCWALLLRNKRNHHKTARRNWRAAPALCNQRKPVCGNGDPPAKIIKNK